MDLILGVGLVLGVMILVHEWGHFIAARIFGVRVDVFSIGFGPRLFGWKRGATDYRVSVLPLGGYVRMAGQDPTEIDSVGRSATEAGSAMPTGAPDELMSKPRWQRAVISFAGPAVNLVFPILLLTVYFVAIGIPYPVFEDKPVVVTALPTNSTAGSAGLQPGDRVISINGEQHPTFAEAEKVISKIDPNSKITLDVENAGTKRTVEMVVRQKDIEQPEQLLGFAPIKPILEDAAPGMPASRAGLREGDVIRAVNGREIHWWGEFTEKVRGSSGNPVVLDVERKNGQIAHLVVAPQAATNDRGETIYQIGVQVHEDTSYRRVAFSEGTRFAVLKTYETIEDTIGVVGKLLSGRVSVKQLQSVVGISRAAGQAVHKGPQAVISLMVLISVNLGILNLLPIPILDGGNILLLAIEGGLRRDLSMAFKERFVQVGLVFLLVLFAIVMYNDVVRLLPSHS
ncbi:MAG TPA: RIP metalloprotease RseP [Candidatus Eisenbacteria bacterium]|jgi:regulator of sigma E protease|nr:RIP metalloprotease RseP [Candidatus Eisenbacteria bacterium]